MFDLRHLSVNNGEEDRKKENSVWKNHKQSVVIGSLFLCSFLLDTISARVLVLIIKTNSVHSQLIDDIFAYI